MSDRAGACLALVIVLAAACRSAPAPYAIRGETSPDGRQRAEVRVTECAGGWCESLWAGSAGGDLVRIAELSAGGERCDEIAWTRDGGRVGFLVNGYQLRLYDARTLAPAGALDLVPADGSPTRRIARGITFSENGKAITFDDCPRGHSGCRPGIVALQ